MAAHRYHLIATVSTDSPKSVRAVLDDFIDGKGSVEEVDADSIAHGKNGELLVQADLEGATAKDLNRSMLSALRKAEKRTSMRSAWKSGETTEHYFDYVLKKTTLQ
jgi:hypothetical protein